jgi:hypothetical protein
MIKRASKMQMLAVAAVLLLLSLVSVVGEAVPASAAGGCYARNPDIHHAYAQCKGVFNTGQIRVLVYVCNPGGSCHSASGPWVYQSGTPTNPYSRKSEYNVPSGSAVHLRGTGFETRATGG